MSPKAQRPLRGGAKTLSSPSSRPSGEASVPPPPAGNISAVFYEETEIWGGCWNARMGDSFKVQEMFRRGWIYAFQGRICFPHVAMPAQLSTGCVWLADVFCLD